MADAKSGFLSNLSTGNLIGAGVSLLPEVFKLFSGRKQIREANKINPISPGFQANNNLIDNARLLEQRYSNYQMPGYGQAVNNIGASAASAYSAGERGATSSGDLLNLVTNVQAGQNQSLNQLAGQNAQGSDQALNQYLGANAQAGNEAVRKNMYDLDIYNQELRRKAALLQAGNENQYGAVDGLANGIRYFTQPQQQITQPGSTATGVSPQKSIFG